MNDIIPTQTPANDNRRTYMMVIYGLYALTIFTAFSCIIGVILAYVKRDDMRGTVYEHHISYLIKTFWVCVICYIIGAATMSIGIGLVFLFIVSLWFIYRVVAGFVKLYDGKPVSPDGWL
ncbi:hypothetical protein GJV52_12210 [Neisseria brasiliensis]|uniref:DUF4870 family protein n=1 Tax=Neisseria TaxID=482 RepID=UPI000C2730A0|nr:MULTISPECIES: DUF4870 domain-containing protein [Neisseria]PJO78865.1 hypothetical protein CWC45_02930 [Neisseria sp. N177_16]QGL26220.1 hypothetical protein GJV52_12210 [Neisseria brasiliensis]